jgi:hypothetical protein
MVVLGQAAIRIVIGQVAKVASLGNLGADRLADRRRRHRARRGRHGRRLRVALDCRVARGARLLKSTRLRHRQHRRLLSGTLVFEHDLDLLESDLENVVEVSDRRLDAVSLRDLLADGVVLLDGFAETSGLQSAKKVLLKERETFRALKHLQALTLLGEERHKLGQHGEFFRQKTLHRNVLELDRLEDVLDDRLGLGPRSRRLVVVLQVSAEHVLASDVAGQAVEDLLNALAHRYVAGGARVLKRFPPR